MKDKNYSPLEYLTGFVMGVIAGIPLEYLLFFLYSVIAKWQESFDKNDFDNWQYIVVYHPNQESGLESGIYTKDDFN